MKLIESCLGDEYLRDGPGSMIIIIIIIIIINNNNNNDNEKFTRPWCLVSVEDGFIETDLYTKPTDEHQCLFTLFCHPEHTKRSIPYSALHFAFAAFALTKTVTYDVLMIDCLTNRG